MQLLNNISSPDDVKSLSPAQLPQLAAEIRDYIIQTVCTNGGHLGASLGTVELIIALHRVFSTPADKIVFDVGHQAYAHKLLTGRYKTFPTLRKAGGLSGFPNPKESPHDAFVAGHASNAISAALGLKEAEHQYKRRGNVVAVVGDGSLTGGLAYEGLNMAATLPHGLIVILNDNGMFIDPTVGSMSRWLTTKLNRESYYRAKKYMKGLLSTLPHGDNISRLLHSAAGSSKAFLTPGFLFAALGFRYLGPLDGHNIDEMEQMFRKVKDRQLAEPVLIHVKTCKGRGYELAERDPSAYHGIGPQKGCPAANTGRSFTDIFGQTLVEMAAKDSNIVAITAAMAGGTGLRPFAEKYPDRFYDVGIAEEHAVTFAAGMAQGGLKPVVALYSTFLQRAVDQIIHDVALPNLPVIFAIDRAGLVGADGATHQGAFDIAMLRYIPNMVIMAPASGAELVKMLQFAAKLKAPVAIRYPRGNDLLPDVAAVPVIELGKAQLVSQDSQKDLLIWSYGHLLAESMKAINCLREEGIGCTLVNSRFVKPLDSELLTKLAKNHKYIVTIEEGSKIGGLGSAVMEALAEKGILKPLLSLGLGDYFIPHGEVGEQRANNYLDSVKIVAAIKEKWSL